MIVAPWIRIVLQSLQLAAELDDMPAPNHRHDIGRNERVLA